MTVSIPAQAETKSYRVLHVLDHSLPLLSGYAVRSRNLIEGQRAIGFRPETVTGPLHELDDTASVDAEFDHIRYRRTPIKSTLSRRVLAKRLPFLREATVVRLFRNRICAILDTEQFDVVHAHSPALCGLAAWLAARCHRLPFVYEIRAFWEDAAVDQNRTQTISLRYHLSRSIEKFVASRADAVVGIATHILDELRGRGLPPAKLFLVPNGVNAVRFSPTPRDRGLAAMLGLDINDEPVFGFFGSLYRYEGIPWLVRAVAELRRRGHRFRVLLAGDGEDRRAVLDAIASFGVKDIVQYLGQVPHANIRSYYSLVDVLVYPRLATRLTELVTPLKPLEAMALGKSVLGSSVGGIRELVYHEETGLIFRAQDVDDFCRQAARLVNSRPLRYELAERARKFVLREKDWSILANRYVQVYSCAEAGFKGRDDSLAWRKFEIDS
jgi:PEP-CTERM/exosortase A-associated glycosyltransferase